MKGIQNFLYFVNENYVSILVCIGLIIGIVQKVIKYFSKSNDEQINIAKEQIKQTMLRMITSAEIDFIDWDSAGSIKRSQVIDEIFKQYPILSKVTNQKEIIDFIDNEINESLKTLRKIVKENKEYTIDSDK